MTKKTFNTSITTYSGAKVVLPHMSNEQENYLPHWLIRLTDEFVADVCEHNGLDVSKMTKDDLVEFIVEKLLNTDKRKYDFGAKTRLNEVAKTDISPVGDVQTLASEFISIIKANGVKASDWTVAQKRENSEMFFKHKNITDSNLKKAVLSVMTDFQKDVEQIVKSEPVLKFV